MNFHNYLLNYRVGLIYSSRKNKTRNQRPVSGTKIRNQILSGEYWYWTCICQAEIYVKRRL